MLRALGCLSGSVGSLIAQASLLGIVSQREMAGKQTKSKVSAVPQ